MKTLIELIIGMLIYPLVVLGFGTACYLVYKTTSAAKKLRKNIAAFMKSGQAQELRRYLTAFEKTARDVRREARSGKRVSPSTVNMLLDYHLTAEPKMVKRLKLVHNKKET